MMEANDEEDNGRALSALSSLSSYSTFEDVIKEDELCTMKEVVKAGEV